MVVPLVSTTSPVKLVSLLSTPSLTIMYTQRTRTRARLPAPVRLTLVNKASIKIQAITVELQVQLDSLMAKRIFLFKTGPQRMMMLR